LDNEIQINQHPRRQYHVPHSPVNDDHDNQPEQDPRDIEDDQVEQDNLADNHDNPPHHSPESLDRSSSPQAGSKRGHITDDSGNDSDVDEVDVHISKAPKVSKKTARPKAGDFDDFRKELVLSAANIYRALLASQGAFPDTTLELKLIKKSWKLVNAESGVKPLTLTPSIVTIVSNSI